MATGQGGRLGRGTARPSISHRPRAIYEGREFGITGGTAATVENPLKTFVIMALAAVVVSGCYLPVKFDAEIEISRAGYFEFEFDGYMASVPLFQGLRQGKIAPDKEAEEVAKLKRDLTRDIWVREFKYIKNGLFKVNWKRTGDLFRARMVTFLRRNERVISIKYFKDKGTILVEGTAIGTTKAKKMVASGLSMQGRLRIRTDGRVIRHNATAVRVDKKRGGSVKIYSWTISSLFDAPPRILIAIN